MSETYEAGDNCPHCGSPATCHDSDEWDWECGTVGYRLRMAQSDRCRKRQLENLLRGWLTAFQKYGPSGSHQFEKFDTIKRDTEMALKSNTEGT